MECGVGAITNVVLFCRCVVSHFHTSHFHLLFLCYVLPQEFLRHHSHQQGQHTMAGFRQEDVELYYEMGEELGRYVLSLSP